jgi:3-hydroxy-9,10-secoandrosta-1,3,5(10)-triene-9,17-dione monooxygenase reductase component
MMSISTPVGTDPDTFRSVMGCLPTGVAVVTADGGDGQPVGCTVSSVTSLSIRPPSLLVSLHTGSRTLARIRESHRFGLNILAWTQRELCRRFSSAPADRRFEGIRYEYQLGVPLLPDAMASLACAVLDDIEIADHTLVIGQPNWHNFDDAANPVVFFRSGFRQLM